LRRDWHGDAWGRCPQAYIGVWEEFGRIKIQIRENLNLIEKWNPTKFRD
jgi:hypothetical protein